MLLTLSDVLQPDALSGLRDALADALWEDGRNNAEVRLAAKIHHKLIRLWAD